MKKLLTMAALAASLLCLSSCYVNIKSNFHGSRHLVKASGAKTTQDRTVESFSRISITGPVDVEFISGGEPAVSVSASENIIDYVETCVLDNNMLYISIADTVNIAVCDARVVVQSGNLTAVYVTGSGEFSAASISAGPGFHAWLTGSGDIEIGSLDSEDVTLDITGSGDISIDALRCATLSAGITGSGDMSLEGEAGKATFKISGSGDIDARGLRVSGGVDQKVAGSGSISL